MTYTASQSITAAGVQADAQTIATTFVWFGKVQNFELIDSNVTVKNRTQNLSREVYSIDRQRVLCRGPVNHEVQNGQFFLANFGNLNTVGASAPYTHTFTTGDTLPNYSIYHKKKGVGGASDVREAYIGCKSNNVKLSVQEGGYLLMEQDVWAIKPDETVTEKVITAVTKVPFRFADIAGGNVSLDGEDIKIMSYEYTRDNKLVDEQAGEYSAEFDPQELDENATVNARMRKTKIRELRRSAALVPLVIKFARSADDYIQITHQVVVREAPEPTGVEGTIDVGMTLDVKSTTIEIKDDVATYEF